jgi:hypothetical protein
MLGAQKGSVLIHHLFSGQTTILFFFSDKMILFFIDQNN